MDRKTDWLPIERIRACSTPDATTGCWNWSGTVRSGKRPYGRLTTGSRADGTQEKDQGRSPSGRATSPSDLSPDGSSQGGIANAVTHIRNGRARLLPHVRGGGETWCGKKLVGQPQTSVSGIEVFNSYGCVIRASIDPGASSCPHCTAAFDAAYAATFPEGLKPIATFNAGNPDDVNFAKTFFSPEGIKRLLNSLDSERCNMGVGCDEAGACYASVQGRPEMCPAQAIEARRAATLGAVHESAVGATDAPIIRQPSPNEGESDDT